MRQGTYAEFASIRQYPNIEIRRMHTKRFDDIFLIYCGKEVGHRTTMNKGNKIASESFMVDETFLEAIKTNSVEAWRL